MKWYKYNPIDTIFCKGSEPMVMGENHRVSIVFPPPPGTIEGALRTSIMRENGISPQEYEKKSITEDYLSVLGPIDGKPGFDIIGPIFSLEGQLFIPAPYVWYIDKSALNPRNDVDEVTIYKGKKLSTSLLESEFDNLYWAKGNDDIISLGGNWMNVKLLNSIDNKALFIKQNRKTGHYPEVDLDKALLSSSMLYSIEPRIGIALVEKRKVNKGHIYSFNHIRINRNVEFIFGVTKELPLPEKCRIKFGGEQRFGLLQSITTTVDEYFKADDNCSRRQSSLFISLSLLSVGKDPASALVATGKLLYIGGWDMYREFHKPMKSYFPPGTVYNQEISKNMIQIQ